MQSISEWIVRVADLGEAEGRVLRAMTVRVALGIAVIAVGALALAAGVGLVLAAVYLGTAAYAGAAVGAVVTGLLSLAIGGGLAWLGRRIGT